MTVGEANPNGYAAETAPFGVKDVSQDEHEERHFVFR